MQAANTYPLWNISPGMRLCGFLPSARHMAAVLLLLAVFPYGSSSAGVILANSCPCDLLAQCEAVRHDDQKEVFGFVASGKESEGYDLSQLSTIAWSDNPDLMCRAHAKGVRVVADGRPGLQEALGDPKQRSQWVFDAVKEAKSHHLDGINFDLEAPAKLGSALAAEYTLAVSQAAKSFHRAIPGSQVSVDVPWSPYDIDGRNYDWLGLAEAADIVFVMSYDMQSQIYGSCVASANSPWHLVKRGLQQYLDLGVPKSKLVLGLPWYGYDYPCQPDVTGEPMRLQDAVCRLAPVPFEGAPCSDAAGSQHDYWDVMQLLRSNRSRTDVRWDEGQRSPYFNYLHEDGSIHQVRFDNPESLKLKYQLAVDLGLRGVGMWHLDALDGQSTDPLVVQQREDMWEAVKVFTDPSSAPGLW